MAIASAEVVATDVVSDITYTVAGNDLGAGEHVMLQFDNTISKVDLIQAAEKLILALRVHLSATN